MVPGPARGSSWDKPGVVPAPASPPGPELSSLATALEDLTKRITAIADSLANTQSDWAAQDLFAVERSLRAGHRRLATLNEQLRRRADGAPEGRHRGAARAAEPRYRQGDPGGGNLIPQT
jgi:hypothetical protein